MIKKTAQASLVAVALFKRLIGNKFFIMITISGNIIITGFSLIIYLLEKETNESINSFLDALWWGFATATTVGYGDIIPETSTGKIAGILLMLIGTTLFTMYTGLVAEAIFEINLKNLKIRRKD